VNVIIKDPIPATSKILPVDSGIKLRNNNVMEETIPAKRKAIHLGDIFMNRFNYSPKFSILFGVSKDIRLAKLIPFCRI
jgi:hypothetical protein